MDWHLYRATKSSNRREERTHAQSPARQRVLAVLNDDGVRLIHIYQRLQLANGRCFLVASRLAHTPIEQSRSLFHYHESKNPRHQIEREDAPLPWPLHTYLVRPEPSESLASTLLLRYSARKLAGAVVDFRDDVIIDTGKEFPSGDLEERFIGERRPQARFTHESFVP